MKYYRTAFVIAFSLILACYGLIGVLRNIFSDITIELSDVSMLVFGVSIIAYDIFRSGLAFFYRRVISSFLFMGIFLILFAVMCILLGGVTPRGSDIEPVEIMVMLLIGFTTIILAFIVRRIFYKGMSFEDMMFKDKIEQPEQPT